MKHWPEAVVVGLLVIGSVALAIWPAPLQFLTNHLEAMGSLSYAVYVILLASAVVFAPVTVMPLIPLAATIFGPFVTGVLSVVGWTLGSVVAFLIARRFGRPLLERFVATEKIDAVIEKFPDTAQFWSIFIMRHLLPVDVLSYALGLIPAVRFRTYVGATVLGVTWFSFAFAYLGDAFFAGNLWILVEVGLASLAIFLGAWYMWRRTNNK